MTIDEIKHALKAQGIKRGALAERLRVSPGTVNNWFSGGRAIPAAKLELIELMLNPPLTPAPETTTEDLVPIGIILTRTEHAAAAQAAQAAGQSLHDYARQMLLHGCRGYLPGS